MFFSIPFLGFQFQTPNRSGRAPFDHFDSSRWLHVSNKWGSSGHLLLANTLDNFSSFMLSMFRWIHIHMNCPTLPDKFLKFVWMDIYWKELSLGIVIIALIQDKILLVSLYWCFVMHVRFAIQLAHNSFLPQLSTYCAYCVNIGKKRGGRGNPVTPTKLFLHLFFFVQRYVEAQCCIASNDYKGKRNIFFCNVGDFAWIKLGIITVDFMLYNVPIWK